MKAKAKVKLSIVIVHYRKLDLLINCIDSIYESSSKVSFEIIVVDNDEKKTILRRLSRRFPKVKYVKSTGNIGYGAGNNLGVKEAEGKYVLILNPDTLVYNKSIDVLVDFLEKKAKAAVVAPNFLHKNGKPYEYQGSRELNPLRAIFALSFINKIFPNNPISKRYFLKNVSFNKIREVDSVPGSCFLIRKKVFNEVGGFDEKFFMFFEEADLFKRTKTLGYKLFITPKAKVVHLHKKSTPKTKATQATFMKSRFLYFKKHFGTVNAIVVETFLRLNIYLLILLLFNVIFFTKAFWGREVIGSFDILQRFATFNQGSFHYVKNSLLFDPVTQFIPWFKYTAWAYKSFQLPLWNPFNGGGVPFMANMQSSVFFPLTFLFVFVNFFTSIHLIYFIKLSLIGLFTYYYLRELGLKKTSSLIGATAFNFAGYNIVWLQWPHTNAIIFLPLLLLLIEKILSKSISKNVFIALTLSIFLLLLSGHPPSIFHVLFITIFYVVIRLRQCTKSLRDLWKKARYIVLAFLIGVGLSSFQIFPFIEYLFNSSVFLERTGLPQREVFIPLVGIFYNIIPNLSGSPDLPFYRSIDPNLSYHESIGPYIGLFPMILVVISVFYLFRKNNIVKTHIIISFVSVLLIYKIPIVSDLFLSFTQFAGNSRLVFYLAFSLSVFTAYFFEKEVYKRFYKLMRLISLSLLMLSLFVPAMTRFAGSIFLKNINPLKKENFISYENIYLIFMFITTAFGFWLIYKLKGASDVKRNFILVIIVVLIFLQTGVASINYNQVVSKDYVYPKTEGVSFLQNQVGGKTIEVGGDFLIRPDVNMWYEIPSVLNYDGLDIRNYKHLFENVFKRQNDWGVVLTADGSFLDLFGVKYLIATGQAEKKQDFSQLKDEKLYGEILPDNNLEFSFTSVDNNLSSIRLLPANYNRANDCTIYINISDEIGNIEIKNKILSCKELLDKSFLEVTFPSIKNSLGKDYTVIISSPDSNVGNAITFYTNTNNIPVYTTTYDIVENENLKRIYDDGIRIYENKTAFNDYYFVPFAKYYGEEKQVLEDIVEKKYDLRNIVLISDEGVDASTETDKPFEAEVEILERNINSSKIAVKTKQPGYLVSTNSYYPGWKVYVNGKRTKIQRSNYAFYSIAIPKGEYFIEFKYTPESFVLGIFVSIVSAFLLIILSRKARYD